MVDGGFVDRKALMDALSLKSGFYTISESINNGRSTPTSFSSTDMTWHKNVRKAVNQFFTQTAVLTYEPFVERTIGMFVKEMDDRFAGKEGDEGIIDLRIRCHERLDL